MAERPRLPAGMSRREEAILRAIGAFATAGFHIATTAAHLGCAAVSAGKAIAALRAGAKHGNDALQPPSRKRAALEVIDQEIIDLTEDDDDPCDSDDGSPKRRRLDQPKLLGSAPLASSS